MGIHSNLQVILKIGAEGGSIAILGQRSGLGNWKFFMETDETAMADLLSGEDRSSLGHRDFNRQSGIVDNFDDALKMIDRYPWHKLCPLKVHSDFQDRVLAEVERRGGSVERWKRLLSQEQ